MTRVTLADQGLETIFGARDENLRRIERAFGVELAARGGDVRISGDPSQVEIAAHLLNQLTILVERGHDLRSGEIKTAIRVIKQQSDASLVEFFMDSGIDNAILGLVSPRSLRQKQYLQAMTKSDLVISIGPAGTGKTFLAVGAAAAFLQQDKVRRIVLARPAVEAGEKLGFLPGDLVEKINPYLRPLYDALYDLIGYEKVGRMMERSIIEVAPLAFMRGRTLNDAFIILDEAQNTTPEQMKMFLTRIGYGSKAVINGDITQIDLPQHLESGLRQARKVLAGVGGIRFVEFDERDVVRHPLVQKIVSAYDRFDKERSRENEGEGGI